MRYIILTFCCFMTIHSSYQQRRSTISLKKNTATTVNPKGNLNTNNTNNIYAEGRKCEGLQVNDTCFFVSPLPMNWTEADDFCKANDSQLLSVSEDLSKKLDEILQKIDGQQNVTYWTGLNKYKDSDNMFTWSDNSSLNYYPPFEVNFENWPNKDCVAIKQLTNETDYEWIWTECNAKFFAVCVKLANNNNESLSTTNAATSAISFPNGTEQNTTNIKAVNISSTPSVININVPITTNFVETKNRTTSFRKSTTKKTPPKTTAMPPTTLQPHLNGNKTAEQSHTNNIVVAPIPENKVNVGAAVGATLGILVVAVIVAYFIRRRRTRRNYFRSFSSTENIVDNNDL